MGEREEGLMHILGEQSMCEEVERKKRDLFIHGIAKLLNSANNGHEKVLSRPGRTMALLQALRSDNLIKSSTF